MAGTGASRHGKGAVRHLGARRDRERPDAQITAHLRDSPRYDAPPVRPCGGSSMSRRRPGAVRADWADPRRLAALAGELRQQSTGQAGPRPGVHAESRPRDPTGRVLSAIKVTIRLTGSGTVRYFDTWTQLSAYLAGEDFDGIAGDVRSILISHRPGQKP